MSPTVWIILGAAALASLFVGKSSRKPARSGGRPERIDHPHYFDVDECECSVCGARFRKRSAVCPKCGARFTWTREDDQEFIEEMILMDDDDDD